MKQKTIKAKVGTNLLDYADRFFDGSLDTTLMELLQNSRRSGATQAKVTTEKCDNGYYITVVDNGSGLEDPEILLGFSDSGWNDTVKEAEEPAGMGFFVLASHKRAHAASACWRVDLTPGSFKGGEVEVTDVEDTRGKGMEVGFLVREFDPNDYNTRYGVLLETRDLGRFLSLCGMVVRFDGILIQPADFLEGKSDGKVFSDDELGVDVLLKHTIGKPWVAFNFHGFTCSLDAPQLPGIYARVQIRPSSKVRMVLPQRKQVREDDAFRALMLRIEKESYWMVLMRQTHSLPYSKWLRAKELGYDLPEARAVLRGIAEAPEVRVVPGTVLVSKMLSRPLCVMLDNLSGYEGNPVLRFAEEDPGMAGYDWYDALPLFKPGELLVDGQASSGKPSDKGEVQIDGEWLEPGKEAEVRLFRLPIGIAVDADQEYDFGSVYWTLDSACRSEEDVSDMLQAACMPEEDAIDFDYQQVEVWKTDCRCEVLRRLGVSEYWAAGMDDTVRAFRYGINRPAGVTHSNLRVEAALPMRLNMEKDMRTPVRLRAYYLGQDTPDGIYELTVERVIRQTCVVSGIRAASVEEAAVLVVDRAGQNGFTAWSEPETELFAWRLKEDSVDV